MEQTEDGMVLLNAGCIAVLVDRALLEKSGRKHNDESGTYTHVGSDGAAVEAS